MMKHVKNIEDNYYGSSLKQLLYKLKSHHPDSSELDIFIQLCSKNINTYVSQAASNELLDNPSALIDIKNKEIAARWREYLAVKFPNNKKEHLPIAVFLYLEIFRYGNDPHYLLHALKLVRARKALFDEDNIERIYQTVKNATLEINISQPFLIKEILIELFSLNPHKVKEDFKVLLNDWIGNLQTAYDFTGAHHLISVLIDIKLISRLDSKIKFAENYEKNGDYQRRDNVPNTYYPTILQYYQNASRELRSIKGEDDLKNRLHAKIINEQQEHAKMHLAVAQNYNDHIYQLESFINNQQKYWLSILVTYNFRSGLHNLLSFPVTIVDNVEKKMTDSTFLSPLFDSAVKQDSKGKIVGKTTLEHYFQVLEKGFIRESIIAFIRETKWRMDEDRKIDKNYVHMLVESFNSPFIPDGREAIFVNGILAGFNNDFLTAAHLLIPQVENSFKQILNAKNIVSFKIDEEVQHDKTLGGILDLLIENTQHDLFYELKDFLTENSSLNFRNELSHGNLSPFIIEHYGIYLWWLTLKMMYNYDEIFKFKSSS